MSLTTLNRYQKGRVQPLGGMLFPPSFGLTGAAYIYAAQDGGLVFPSVALAVLTLLGAYVWKYTRRADAVLLARIEELEIDRNFNRAKASYYQRWALSGIEPVYAEPTIQDFQERLQTDGG